MNVSLACLVPAALLPYVWASVALQYRKLQLGAIDNKEPRAQSARLTGAGGRAYAAHMNAFEALAVFAPAVIAANVAGVDATTSARLTLGWVVVRVAHGISYVVDADRVRSFCFVAGLGCAVALYGLAATAR